MSLAPDHLILCVSQPSLSARAEGRSLAALHRAGRTVFDGPVTAVRLEGPGPGLAAALRAARDGGARRVRVQPVGFPLAANILAWLPGAVAHFAATEAGDMAVDLADPPEPEEAAVALAPLLACCRSRDARTLRPALGKPGWQYLPAFDTHILVCTGPRCAFLGSGTLQARLKARLAETGLAERCLVTTTGCLFPCNQGPVLAVYPRGLWFRVPDEAALRALVCEVIGKGLDLPRLRLAQRPRRVAS
ncbi:MAG: (2Fe-2S) ferredoxin domain-containing protein [Pararhodobacter sp.]